MWQDQCTRLQGHKNLHEFAATRKQDIHEGTNMCWQKWEVTCPFDLPAPSHPNRQSSSTNAPTSNGLCQSTLPPPCLKVLLKTQLNIEYLHRYIHVWNRQAIERRKKRIESITLLKFVLSTTAIFPKSPIAPWKVSSLPTKGYTYVPPMKGHQIAMCDFKIDRLEYLISYWSDQFKIWKNQEKK